jgi:PAS domain S-box-containing protein
MNKRSIKDDQKSKQQLIEELEELRSSLQGAEKIKAALRESERRLSDIIDFLPDATFAIDLEGRIIAWNKAIETMTGIKAASMLGKGNYEYSLPFYGKRRPILIDLVFVSDEEIKTKYHFVQKKDGVLLAEADVSVRGEGIRHLWGKAGSLFDSNGKMVGAIEAIRDITDQRTAEKDRKRLEEHLQRSEKMKALGTLAGGVAHDLNNVLGVIIGYAELLLYGMSTDNPVRPRLASILKSGERAAAIVQDLLTLARRGVYNREVFNLNSVVEEFLQSPEFIRLSSHNPFVKLTTQLDPQLNNISGSLIHFSKALFNLVGNAIEAMPEGGNLRITTTNQYLDKPVDGYDNVRAGDYAVLTVLDTGGGITQKDMKHIFEPFYTKKVMGKSGTGLGLAVVWGSVEDHDGYISVESSEGAGSVFTLYLPVTMNQIKNEDRQRDIAEYMGQGETILIVDDIKEQRELAAEILGKLDYQVIPVASGEEGIEYLKKHVVDLVVLDMIMDPGRDGLDTYTEMKRWRPDQKALIVSGFAETERVTRAQALGAGRYLKKPYLFEQLGVAVRNELDRIV